MMAAKHGAAEIVEILIKAHADVNIRENVRLVGESKMRSMCYLLTVWFYQ